MQLCFVSRYSSSSCEEGSTQVSYADTTASRKQSSTFTDSVNHENESNNSYVHKVREVWP